MAPTPNPTNPPLTIVVIGGTGLIGSKLITVLRERGHVVVAASPKTGVDTLTGAGLAEVLQGADVVVDVTNSPSFADDAVMHFFRTSTTNLLAAEATAGVRHHVALTIVGTDRLPDSGYFRAKVVQEELIRAGTIPYSLVHATQFFEFVGAIADGATVDGIVRIPPVQFQPIASDDVAEAVGRVAVGPPLDASIDIAGPNAAPFAEVVATVLAARGDARPVVADPEATYFGAHVIDGSLVPTGEARLGTITLADWLRSN